MNELDRIRVEYARRDLDPQLHELYSFFRPDVQFTVQMRTQAVLKLLSHTGFRPLADLDILEIGCGEGGVMLDLLRWEANSARLHGCDLLPDRMLKTRQRLPISTTLVVADGAALPYPAARFDLVLQFTVFTSVLDEDFRQRIAQDMWRVLRPGGAVLWYDFRFQGRNPAVRAIHPREVRALFPQGDFTARRVTLAPPITRRLASWAWLACEALLCIPWLRSHDLILIQKKEA